MKGCFDLTCYVWSMTTATWALSNLGRWDEAIELGQTALRVAEEYSNSSAICFAAWVISWSYNWRGDIQSANEFAELALKNAPTPVDQAWAQQALAWAQCKAGDPRKGTEILAALLPNFRGFMPSELSMTLQLGEGYWLGGEDDLAKETLEYLLEIAERCQSRFYLASGHRILGEVALKIEIEQAAPHFDKSISLSKDIKAENELALAYSGFGRLHKAQGNIEQARAYLEEALEIFERLGTLIEPDKVREELAELPKE
jgi:tetratricopeptide (TPR) repeat protein